MKLTDVLNNDKEDNFNDKIKISHENLTISSLKELSADFENDNESDNDEINNDKFAEDTFKNIGSNETLNINEGEEEILFEKIIKEDNEKLNVQILEEINNLRESKLVSEKFYESTLPLISENIKDENFEDKIISFEEIFHDIRGEILTEKHISDIVETLDKLINYISNRSSENRDVFERSILHLEESLFESQQEESEEVSLIKEGHNEDQVDIKLDMIIKELLDMKERISVVKAMLTDLN